MPETPKPREMTLPAIRKRFDYGSWDHYDCLWLYSKAEQHAHLLSALDELASAVQDGQRRHNAGDPHAIASSMISATLKQAVEAIRKASS
jgi:hypothetical protein